MRLRNAALLDKFVRKHRDARAWTARWRTVVEAANWQNLNDVRFSFASADGVRVPGRGGVVVVVTVFKVKGNEYRLLTVISYQLQSVIVVDVLTHAEYDRDKWKDRI